MGFFDLFRKRPEKTYAPTEVTKALDATLLLWNALVTKYSQAPRMIYEKSPRDAEELSNRLAAGIQILLNGLAGAQRKNQEVNPKEVETLRNRLKVFKVKKELLDNLIATGGVKSRR